MMRLYYCHTNNLLLLVVLEVFSLEISLGKEEKWSQILTASRRADGRNITPFGFYYYLLI